MKRIRSIKGKYVAVTGECWIVRKDLAKKVRSRGGRFTSDGNVTHKTNVLVRGDSYHWKFGEYGVKEARAAEYIEGGQEILVIDDYEFRKLVEYGKPARCSD